MCREGAATLMRDIEKEQVEALLEKIVAILRETLHPARILLFGSRSKGEARPYSDFDIAVAGADLDLRKERVVKEKLDEGLGIYTVDVIDLDRVEEDFRDLVLRTGRVLYEE